MTSEPALADKVRLIDRTLDRAEIPHAIGGALALAYYGEPRLTVDIDVNLFVSADQVDDVLTVLEPLGVDTSGDRDSAVRDGQLRTWWGRNPVDLFFAYDPFHEAMDGRARTVPFGGSSIRILAPEHLIVCKAAFDRPKDWIDIEQMMVGVDRLDRDELEGWLARVLGPEDERSIRVRELWEASR